jgi:hypothetical protein
VNRCNEAINRSALLSSVGGPSDSTTKVPAPRTQSRATHAELLREIALWRQSIARPQLASMNHFTKLRDDFFE